MEPDPALLVAGRYSEQAPAYRRHWAPLLLKLGLGLVDRLPLSESARVLEVGAGVGALLAEIHRRAPGAFVVGADIAEGMIRLAPPDIARVVANAAALPFGDGVFDAVVMAFVLFHVPEPAAAVAEVRRVVRPGGTVGVGTWRTDDPVPAAQRVWVELLDQFGAPPEQDGVARHELMDTPEGVGRLLEAGGFEVIEQEERASVDPMDLEEFVLRRTSLGEQHRRLRRLDPGTQEVFLRTARERLAGMGSEDFAGRETAILTWARRKAV